MASIPGTQTTEESRHIWRAAIPPSTTTIPPGWTTSLTTPPWRALCWTAP